MMDGKVKIPQPQMPMIYQPPQNINEIAIKNVYVKSNTVTLKKLAEMALILFKATGEKVNSEYVK